MRSALPMNLKGDFPNFKVWTRAQADIDRITGIWRECLGLYGGPFLLGDRSMADAMYAPVATRFLTYHVKLDKIRHPPDAGLVDAELAAFDGFWQCQTLDRGSRAPNP